LTLKEEKYARLVVELGSYHKAFMESYPGRRGSAQDHRTAAWIIAQRPQVKAKINELRQAAVAGSLMLACERRAMTEAIARGEVVAKRKTTTKMGDGTVMQTVEEEDEPTPQARLAALRHLDDLDGLLVQKSVTVGVVYVADAPKKAKTVEAWESTDTEDEP
jgi:hypothetical protein